MVNEEKNKYVNKTKQSSFEINQRPHPQWKSVCRKHFLLEARAHLTLSRAPHNSEFRDHSWQGLGKSYGMLGIDLGQLYAKKVPSLLTALSFWSQRKHFFPLCWQNLWTLKITFSVSAWVCYRNEISSKYTNGTLLIVMLLLASL